MKALTSIISLFVATMALAAVASAAELDTAVLDDFGPNWQLNCHAVNVGTKTITSVVVDLVGTDGSIKATNTCSNLAADGDCGAATANGANISARCRVTITGGSKSKVRAVLFQAQPSVCSPTCTDMVPGAAVQAQ